MMQSPKEDGGSLPFCFFPSTGHHFLAVAQEDARDVPLWSVRMGQQKKNNREQSSQASCGSGTVANPDRRLVLQL